MIRFPLVPVALLAIGWVGPSAAVAQANAAYADAVLADEPVAFFRLRETAGTAIADTAGDHAGEASASGVALDEDGPDGAGFGAGNSGAAFDRGETGVIRLSDGLTAALEALRP